MNWMMNQPERIIQKIKMNVYLKKKPKQMAFLFFFLEKKIKNNNISAK